MASPPGALRLPGRRIRATRSRVSEAPPAAGSPGQAECDRLQRVYEMFLARQRQLAAVLEAHGIPLLYVHADGRQDPRVLLAQPG